MKRASSILATATFAVLLSLPAANPTRSQEVPLYEEKLVRLAQVLGSVHYLRNLCVDDEETVWREKMQDILELEAPEPERRAKLTASFNRGYRSFASVYIECTPAAIEAEENYRKEGAALASEIVARYGN